MVRLVAFFVFFMAAGSPLAALADGPPLAAGADGPPLAAGTDRPPLAAGANTRPRFFPEIALGPVAGTTGFGFQVATPILPGRLNLNTGFSVFATTHDVTADNIPFRGKLGVGLVPVFLSLYPFAGRFHLDAGFYLDANRISATAVAPTDTNFTLNGHHYSAGNIGTLEGRTHFNPVAPYLGFGFGNPFRGGRWTVTLNAGVMFEGGPDIRLFASNPQILLIPGAAADIRNEQESLNRQARFLQFYPVVNLGLMYRF